MAMLKSKFDAHGDFSLEAADQLLVIHAFNGWNLEQSLAFKAACEKMIRRHLSPGPFFCLVFTHEWLPTLDSVEPLRSVTDFAIQNGMRAQAFCFSNSLEREILLTKISPRNACNFERAAFLDEVEAKLWLAQFEEAPTSVAS